MTASLAERAARDGLRNISTQVSDPKEFNLMPASADLVVKVIALAAKGPGGWWRIAKNLTRYGLGVGQEHPATPEFWQAALRDAEFTGVVFQPVIAEAGIVRGMRPAA